MRINDQSAGAMPVAEGATPSQSYPFGPAWAPYRLPLPGLNGVVTPREIGIGFEGEAGTTSDSSAGDAGATTGTAAGATTDSSATDTSATDEAQLGEGGKRAIAAERAKVKAAEDRAKAAEKERDDLKLATASDSEKAIAAAKKAGADEVLTRVHAQVRRSEVKAALSAAGINASVLDLAAKADEFAALKVDDEGEVEGLADAIKDFKKARADLFTKPGSSGTADGGTRGSGEEPAKDLMSALERHYAPARG